MHKDSVIPTERLDNALHAIRLGLQNPNNAAMRNMARIAVDVLDGYNEATIARYKEQMAAKA